MRLRTRLLAFSTAQLVAFGCAFLGAYLALEHYVMPVIEGDLRTRTLADVDRLARELDVAVGANDKGLVAGVVRRVAAEHDFGFVEVRDAAGAQLYARGEVDTAAFSGSANVARRTDGDVRAWLPIDLEGMHLGRVALGFSTDRIDGIRAWTRGLALGFGVVWVGALGVALAFSRAFVAPLHAMIAFSRRLAAGSLDEELGPVAASTPTEIADLAADLDAIRIAQRRFVDVSRLAGMAEVATGVLHDVGNALTSLNVAVAVAGDELRDTKAVALGKIAEQIVANAHDPAYWTSDRGKLVPGYLAALAKRLADERARLAEEIAAMAKHVEHVKVIVARQQTYAQTPVADEEPVALAVLVDDALAMGQTAFERHDIEVVRDIAGDLPPVVTDRHKVLQILVNLVNNARQAVTDQPARRLVVRAARTEQSPQRIAISVTDTGVGIAPEHVARIFQHGFTTKPDGHGFGLHASANAARQLGGALSASSAGLGAGATFRLELPVHRGATA